MVMVDIGVLICKARIWQDGRLRVFAGDDLASLRGSPFPDPEGAHCDLDPGVPRWTSAVDAFVAVLEVAWPAAGIP